MSAKIGKREGEKMAAGELKAKAEEASHSSMHERGNEYESAGKKEGMGVGMGRAKNTISKTLYERVTPRGENQGKFFSQGFY